MKSTIALSFAAAFLLFSAARSGLSAPPGSSSDNQRRLIAVLLSEAPAGEKAISCKQLAIYGNKEAIPALAPLLENKELASWARVALEAIPGPEADAALRAVLPRVQGILLIGAINSLGVRRDARAVDVLSGKLGDPDPEIAAAAAAALGKIGGMQAATVLGQTLANAREAILPAVAEGCILCAEGFLADNQFAAATALYDAVRNKAGLSTQKRLEATRGAILARQSAGLPLLLAQLRSPGKAEFGMALRTARELPGREVTEALGAEMNAAEADRQVMLLLALADRKDAAVLPKLLEAAQNGSRDVRIAALGLLDRFGDAAAAPILLVAAAGEDADLAAPAKATLTRMEGTAVDEALLSRLPAASGKTRQVIIELAALRRIHSAVPAVLESAGDGDAGVRRAAFATLSTLGSEQHAGELIRLLGKTQHPEDREGIETALGTICGRAGTKCLPKVLPLTRNEDPEIRVIGLRTLATIGGSEAVAAVASAIQDPDETVQDEAVGTLATWPNNWPDDGSVAAPLLNLARTGRKPAYKIKAVRGYFSHLQENRKLGPAEKLEGINHVLPLLNRPEEKRLAITTLGGIPAAKSLDILAELANDAALAEEASLAIVKVATGRELEGGTREIRRQALEMAIQKSKNDSTREKAKAALESM